MLASKAYSARLIPAPFLLSSPEFFSSSRMLETSALGSQTFCSSYQECSPIVSLSLLIPSQHVELNPKITSSGKPSLTTFSNYAFSLPLITPHVQLNTCVCSCLISVSIVPEGRNYDGVCSPLNPQWLE